MKTNKILTTLIACSIVGSAIAAPKAQWTTIQSTNNKVLISNQINSPKVNVNKDAVSFSYKLDASEKLEFNAKPFVENSKQYWLDSTGNKLLRGISLPVTGGDTIIRISPLTNDKSIQLTADMIQIQNNGSIKKINVFADSKQLNATGAAFSDDSIALKIKAQAGNLNLKVDNFAGETPFVIHVFEPKSQYVLSLSSTKASYDANQTISIKSDFNSANQKIDAQLQGYINRPDGSVLGEITFTKAADGGYNANIEAVGAQGLAQGLWEVHVFAKGQENGQEIMRDAQTSFAVNLNTAAFNGELNMVKNNIQVGIDVGLAGRYEVRGVLMGTDAITNELKPIAMTMSANWLKAGTQSVSLEINPKFIAESDLISPYELKNIQLTNQTYFAPVQTVVSGIKLLDIK